jgi:alkylhydroperoxidase family enzyme
VGRKAGLTDEKLRAVANIADPASKDLSIFNDTERLVIELADAMVMAPANISDDLYARLREKFSEEQLMQLSAQIAFENYRARWNRVFNLGSDELYHPG